MSSISKPQGQSQQPKSQSQATKPQSTKSQSSQPQASPSTTDRRAVGEDRRDEEIRPLAYQKWEEAGCPSGDGIEFWLAAEIEILRRKKPR